MNLGSLAGGFPIDFRLTDDSGSEVTAADYRGRHLLVYFGFTHCQVVCPAAMAKLSDVLEMLGGEAEELVPLFVSVDPARDTPEVLRHHLAQKYPAFVGLTGTPEAIEAAKTSFRVFSRPRAQDPAGTYQVAHTAFTYLVDPSGVVATHLSDSADAVTMVAAIRTVLRGATPIRSSGMHEHHATGTPCH
jgi:protein SCO1/2